MKKIVCLLAFIATATLSYGQMWKDKAESYLNKQMYHEADSFVQKNLTEALQNPKTKPSKLATLYRIGAEANCMIAQGEFGKAGAQLPFDTVACLNAIERGLEFAELSNRYDLTPSKPGAEPKPQYVARNKEIVSNLLFFYSYAGYFFAETDQAKAAGYFSKFASAYKHPVYSAAEQDSIYHSTRNYSNAQANAAMMYYQLKDWQKLIPVAGEAVKDTANRHNAYLMLCEAYTALHDTASWVNTLKSAIENDPNNTPFIESLQVYYIHKNDVAGAEEVADRLIASPEQEKQLIGYYMKGCVELNMRKRYPQARELFEKVLAINPDHKESHVNIGASLINEAVDLIASGKYKYVGHEGKAVPAKEKPIYEKELAEQKSFYQRAQSHYERARELWPDNSRAWAYPLYKIYEVLEDNAKKTEVATFLEN